MKKFIYCVVALVVVLLASCEKNKPVVCEKNEPVVWTIDLSKSQIVINYDDNGLWTDVLNPEIGNIELEHFSFHHEAIISEYEWDGQVYQSVYYLGFVPSANSTSNPDIPQSAITKGGLQGKGTPYMVAYWGDYFDWLTSEQIRTTDIVFTHRIDITTPQYVYLTNTADVVNTIKNGGAFGARAFADGDYFLIRIKALNWFGEVIEDREVEYYLADFRDGKSFINESWAKVDLTPLGQCAGITFELESTDSNEYGILTPTYFALDGLTVQDEWLAD